MTDIQKAEIAVKKLKEEYPNSECSLIYSNPLQLLIAIRLSAQCTDARVNIVTAELFSKFKSLDDFSNATTQEIAKYIRSCGFYRIKSNDIINMCKAIKERFNGIIPDNMDDLTSLPGIGRKTANLFLSEVYKRPAIIVDTHFIRITKRLGFHDTKDANKIEKIMKKLINPSESSDFCHRIVAHGRNICTARSPKCLECCLKNICRSFPIAVDNKIH